MFSLTSNLTRHLVCICICQLWQLYLGASRMKVSGEVRGSSHVPPKHSQFRSTQGSLCLLRVSRASLVPGAMEVTCSETPAICLVDPHAVTQWTRVSAQGLETRWVNERSLADVATVFQMSRDAFQKSSLS